MVNHARGAFGSQQPQQGLPDFSPGTAFCTEVVCTVALSLLNSAVDLAAEDDCTADSTVA